MKRFIVFTAMALGAVPLFAAQASPACAAKRTSIETQISEANAHGQRYKLAGLQRALRANQAGCTDASLAKERDVDIAKASKNVSQREAELGAAQRKGDAKKVAKQQQKLDEARSELSEASKPLLP
jgi:hypothetical protein